MYIGCLDTITLSKQNNLTVIEEAKEKTSTTKIYTKDDFSIVNRFESKCLSLLFYVSTFKELVIQCDLFLL